MTVLPINLGPWMPDRPDFLNPGLTRAFNVVPGDDCYKPIQRERLYSETTMASRPCGATSGLDGDGNAMVFGGDVNHLYRLQPGSTQWADVSRTGNPYSGDASTRWRFGEYGSLTIATNYTDAPQAFDRDTDVRFRDLTAKVKGRYIMVVKDFVVLGNIFTPLDGRMPNSVQWSGIGDPGMWDYTPTTMSDFSIIAGFGDITGMVGGEYGHIFMQRGIARMTFTRDDNIFDFSPVVDKGCKVPESLISVEGRTFFLSDDGFYMFDGSGLKNIGLGKINKTFLTRTSNVINHNAMTVEVDPASNLVYWLYASNSAFNGRPDRYLIYNYATDNWSEGESGAVTSIFRSMSLPFTIDELDEQYARIDAVPAPWDSPLWSGGKAYLAGLDDQGRPYSMSGENRTAEMSTGDFTTADLVRQVDPRARGTRALVRGIRPDVHVGGDALIRARISGRPTLQAPLVDGPFNDMNVLGECPARMDNRYHRISVRLDGDWTQAISVQLDAVNTGSR